MLVQLQPAKRNIHVLSPATRMLRLPETTILLLAFSAIVAQDPCVRAGVDCGRVDHATVNTVLMSKAVTRNPGRSRANHCPQNTNFANLEDLWEERHFRGPFTGPRSYFQRVPKHYLGHHANFSKCRRKVYIDVGAGQFAAHGSSEGFLGMMKLYPSLVDFDEFYAFEAVPGLYKFPPDVTSKAHNVDLSKSALCI